MPSTGAMARQDRRTQLGGDIMIHGSDCSIGCLAMGDDVAEDLFVLAQETGLRKIKVIITPTDLRTTPTPQGLPGTPAWIARLYAEIRKEMQLLPTPKISKSKIQNPKSKI